MMNDQCRLRFARAVLSIAALCCVVAFAAAIKLFCEGHLLFAFASTMFGVWTAPVIFFMLVLIRHTKRNPT